MGLLFLLMAGAVLGWLAAIITQTDYRRSILLNATIGILGALIAGLVVTPLTVGDDMIAGHYDVDALLISLAGAIGLLLIVNVLRPDVVR